MGNKRSTLGSDAEGSTEGSTEGQVEGSACKRHAPSAPTLDTLQLASNFEEKVNLQPSIQHRVAAIDKTFTYNQNSHAFANRVYHILVDVVNRPPTASDTDASNAIKENLRILIHEQNFQPPAEFTMVRPDRISEVKFLGYKLAAIMIEEEHRFVPNRPELYMNAIALLHLSVLGSMKASDTGKDVPVNQLTHGTKLCTDEVITVGVQFLGPIQHTVKLVEYMNAGKLTLVSQFNSKFKYRIGYKSTEPNFGQPGIGCIQGINFFPDKDSAIKYLAIGFGGINLFSPVITEVVAPVADPAVHEAADRREMHEVVTIDPEIRAAYEEHRQNTSRQLDIVGENTIHVGMHNYQIGHSGFNPSTDERIECSVCHKQVWSKNPFMGKCQHIFHYECINEKNIIDNKCPLCTAPLVWSDSMARKKK